MKIISVVSAKGGVGKSTFCCGVAKMLSENGKRTLLVDMDIGVRSLDLLLGVSEKTVYNWGDIIKDNCNYQKAVTEVSDTLWLLPAPIDFSPEFTPEAFCDIIKGVENNFDFIILDSPAGIESGFSLAVKSCDCCVVMTTPDAVGVRAAATACERARKEGVGAIRLVVNRFNKKIHKSIDIDEYIDSVGARLLGIIPDSSEIFAFQNGKKIPYDCKGNQAFLRISKRLCGENVLFKVRNI